MTIKWIVRLAPVAAVSLLSACSTTGSPYTQGPWGPSPVQRAHSQHSAPWRGRNPAAFADLVNEPAPNAVFAGDVEPRVPSPGRLARSDAELPFDPLPHDYEMRPSDPAPVDGAPLDGLLQGPEVAEDMPAPSREAALPSTDPAVVSAPTRVSSYAGNWKAMDDKGASCRVQLSSVPALDLYKASASGCANESLKGVNAWSFRENTVMLYSRGEVVARLSGLEASLSGSFSRSEDALRMTR